MNVGQLVMIDGEEYEVTRIGRPDGQDTLITVVPTHGYPVGQRMSLRRVVSLVNDGRWVPVNKEEATE